MKKFNNLTTPKIYKVFNVYEGKNDIDYQSLDLEYLLRSVDENR